jgi:hypothetical protein
MSELMTVRYIVSRIASESCNLLHSVAPQFTFPLSGSPAGTLGSIIRMSRRGPAPHGNHNYRQYFSEHRVESLHF